MALYLKQDFTPPVLSRKWITMKFRPNMLVYSHTHIVSILESGLLFREDSVEVEQESPLPELVWRAAGGGRFGWMTGGEQIVSVVAVGACVAVFPPRSLSRASMLKLSSYLLIPLCVRTVHRRACRGRLSTLLLRMRDYLALARRAAACLRDCSQLQHQLESVSSVLESTHSLLCQQQSHLAVAMSRASSALLGNAPWLRSDVAWHAVQRGEQDGLMKIHHAFLVVQSTLLKHIAMAHYVPTPHVQKLYKNHNERIYWIHHTLIQNLIGEFEENFEALERMYRLLKNYGSNDMKDKKLGNAMVDNWVYSEVHSGIARTNLELKIALNKCNNLDNFLDSCALNKQDINLAILNNDIDKLIDDITKCLSSVQSAQIRLKKLQRKLPKDDTETENELEIVTHEANIVKLDDCEPEAKDEVFYFVKTDDDDVKTQPASDVTSGPGKVEKEATRVVLDELKRKLVKREDVMRERERQALVKTMPEFKDKVPEFPRQMKLESGSKGYIGKVAKKFRKKRPLLKYKIKSPNLKSKSKYKLVTSKYKSECDINAPIYEANSNLHTKSKFLTFFKRNKFTYVTKWFKQEPIEKVTIESDFSDGFSDLESVDKTEKSGNKIDHRLDKENRSNHRESHGDNGNQSNHRESGDDISRRNGERLKFSKKELELSPSSSDSDLDMHKERQNALLQDVRRYRAARKKNHPVKKVTQQDTPEDESLRPIEYSLGAGLAMASILQQGRGVLGGEEVFAGDGEVSSDSGNDEDA